MRESGDPELIARFNEIETGRLHRLADLGPQLEMSGLLRVGISSQVAIDRAWSLTSPATYEQLVLDRGWTPDLFEDWLGAALAALILPSRGPTRPQSSSVR